MERNVEQEFLDVYDTTADPVFRRCYFKTSDEDVARDLTQETFTKVWDYLASGKEVHNLRAFIFTVANNLIKDYYKKSKSVPMGTLLDYDPNSIPDPHEDVEAKAEVEQMLRMLRELSDEDRDLLIMRLVEEMSPKQIADLLGERENTVSVRIYRARKRLLLLMAS
jgi:RNA polymerase sigma-70 factor (ECF subfamily)